MIICLIPDIFFDVSHIINYRQNDVSVGWGSLVAVNQQVVTILDSIAMNRAMVNGNTIEDGDYLLVDSDQTSPSNGDIVLSVIDDMANIKKYVWDEANNQIVLVSESTKDIPPIYIHEDDSFMINGKVIQVIKKPKY